MKTIKGPGIFLAQFIGAQAPFNTLEGLAVRRASAVCGVVCIVCSAMFGSLSFLSVLYAGHGGVVQPPCFQLCTASRSHCAHSSIPSPVRAEMGITFAAGFSFATRARTASRSNSK